MKNIIEISGSQLLLEIAETAVREALQMQRKADKEWALQHELEMNKKPFNFTKKNTLDEGTRAVCHVLWKVFGGCVADHLSTIEKISNENPSDILGLDRQDYVSIYLEALMKRAS